MNEVQKLRELIDGSVDLIYEADARGYVRVVGQSVVAGRVQYFNSDATLPPYERLLLGGSSNLRGFLARMRVTASVARRRHVGCSASIARSSAAKSMS